MSAASMDARKDVHDDLGFAEVKWTGNVKPVDGETGAEVLDEFAADQRVGMSTKLSLDKLRTFWKRQRELAIDPGERLSNQRTRIVRALNMGKALTVPQLCLLLSEVEFRVFVLLASGADRIELEHKYARWPHIWKKIRTRLLISGGTEGCCVLARRIGLSIDAMTLTEYNGSAEHDVTYNEDTELDRLGIKSMPRGFESLTASQRAIVVFRLRHTRRQAYRHFGGTFARVFDRALRKMGLADVGELRQAVLPAGNA